MIKHSGNTLYSTITYNNNHITYTHIFILEAQFTFQVSLQRYILIIIILYNLHNIQDYCFESTTCIKKYKTWTHSVGVQIMLI